MRIAIGKRSTSVIGGTLLLAIGVAVMVLAIGHNTPTTQADNRSDEVMSLRVPAEDTFDCAGGPVQGKVVST